jgi:hypothetical protein
MFDGAHSPNQFAGANPLVVANYCFEFQKRSQQLICMHNETLSVAAMCVSNEDRSPFTIHGCTQPQVQPAFLRLSAIFSQGLMRRILLFLFSTSQPESDMNGHYQTSPHVTFSRSLCFLRTC